MENDLIKPYIETEAEILEQVKKLSERLDKLEKKIETKGTRFSIKNNQKKSCYFCGATVSVKYEVQITDLFGEEVMVPCCNKCLLKKISREEE